jgi:fructose-1,6-bisphosphatase II / sedoheptulose-1,7-bisphosphatase
MTIDKKYINHFISVTSKAALASSYLVGKKDKNAADQAAVDSMRTELNKINMNGKVVIGEGTLDEAPMLYSVIAMAEKGNLFNAPETYMDKIATGKIEKGLIDLDYPLKKNIHNLAEFMNKDISSITACILDRPRHKKMIDELKNLKVNLKLITDGDVLGALYVSDPKYNVDIFLGIGGGPEGVLAASALDAYNCHFQGRFIFDNDKDISDAKKMGIIDLNKKYELNEIVKGDSIFCASGITSSEVLKGIKIEYKNYVSETLVTHKSTGFKKIIKNTNAIKE